MSGHHFDGKTFEFDSIPKFEKARATLNLISPLDGAAAHVEQLKKDLIQGEHFLNQKFIQFLSEFVPKSFWELEDELYPKNELLFVLWEEC